MPAKTTFSLEDQAEVFATSTASSAAIRKLLHAGRVRQVGARLYTKNLDEPLDEVVRRQAWHVASLVMPGAVIVDRSAFEMRPLGPEGSIFLSASQARRVQLPGLVLNARRGPGPVEGDTPFLGEGLHLSSWPRRFLDNMRPSRARGGARRTLTRPEVEARLEQLLSAKGEQELNRLREDAARIAPQVDRQAESEQLSALIGALLGTREASLASPLARAAREGASWDDRRLALFDVLFAALHERVPVDRPAHDRISPAFSFYEAYFSNFIEGTEFTVEEAQEIVFRSVVPVDRPKDAHDVLGTFDLISDPSARARVPRDAEDLLAVLRRFHQRIMAGRPEERPGEFKVAPNRAGSTEFVAPRRVIGTLRRGWDRLAALEPGFNRAVFAMFLVAEVHPFADGNGRVARALMNAELSAARQQRLMVPIVMREDYLQALRAMSRLESPGPMIRVLDRAQDWARQIDWSSVDAARSDLERTNSLLTPSEAEERGVILRTVAELDAAGVSAT